MVRILITFIVFFFATQSMAADCGVFKVVKGDVTFKKSGKPSYKKARKNKKVCQGDTVKTADSGRTKIVMADKNEINVSPNTEMIIESYKSGKQAVLNVLNGKVRSDVKNKYKDNKQSHYRVKTKSAVAGVRGTEFLASYDAVSNQSRIVTFEGQVAVGQMNGEKFIPQVVVRPGQFTSNRPGTAPHAARDLPPAELAKMDRDSNIGAPEPAKGPASVAPTKEKDNSQQPKANGPKGPNGPNGNGPGAKNEAPAKDDGSNGFVDNDQKGEPTLGAGGADRSPASVSDSNPLPPPAPPSFNDSPLPPTYAGNPDDYIPKPPDVTTNPTFTDPVINKESRVTIIPVLPTN